MSTRDHPDWWRPVGGQNSQDSTLERRSTIWNDGDPIPPAAPPAFHTGLDYRGKFFTRGCRGMIENLQIYCIRTAAGTLDLSFSPHPCIGPLYTVTITPGAAWAWALVAFQEMWNYDSLFIWVSRCDADVSYGFDTVQPLDGHRSTDAGATWLSIGQRPYIRVIYTGETPGDVPVSGIINNVPIPYASSEYEVAAQWCAQNVETFVVGVHGAGYNDLIVMHTQIGAEANDFYIRVYADGVLCFHQSIFEANLFGYDQTTPRITLPSYNVDGRCVLLISKRFEFRRSLEVYALNTAGPGTVGIRIFPTLMR